MCESDVVVVGGRYRVSCMMISSNENIFRVTGTGQRPTARSFFIWAAPEQTVEQIMETPVIWDDIALIMTLM